VFAGVAFVMLAAHASFATQPEQAAPTLGSCSRQAISVHLDDDRKPVVPTPQQIEPRQPDERDQGSGAVQPTDEQLPMPQFQPAPGGGEMLLLDQRFRHDMRATRRSSDSVAVECTQPPSKTSAE